MELTGSDEAAPFGYEEDGTPKAPYGVKADGSVKKTSGRPATAAPKAPAARKKTAAEAKAAAKSGTDYTEGILGLMQLPAAGLGLAGMKAPVYAADAAVITAYAPGLAEALNSVAQEQPAVAAVLDRVLAVGPWGAVLAVAMPMALQLLVNHEVMPAGLGGTVPKEAILGQMEKDAILRQAEAAEAAFMGAAA